MFVSSGKPIQVSHMSNTRAEPEIAFELARPLRGPGVTIEAAMNACSRVWAAIEVIDSRVGAMRAKAQDSLADNAGAGKVVLGTVSLRPDEVDLSAIAMSMDVDGQRQDAMSGDVMGHPAAPLAWLANKLPELGGLGGALHTGDVVITGAPIRSVEVRAGSRLHASFGPLGEIDLSFS
jgi:2-keto-4-pentenoate hydratase